MALASAAIWMLLVVTIVGAIYGLLIGLVLFFAHVGFIAHVRGSAVRLGPEQFPDLYRRVEEMAARAGLPETPAAYLMQHGGALNALATRLFRSDMMVLFSDLLEACGDDEGARDMIIGHELGHIKGGHLRWAWLLAPGRFVPFLGAAWSRAMELTCDRFGAALTGDPAAATRGLAILAAGGSHARQVNLSSFVAQRGDLDTGWMTLAGWLSGYPPLAERIATLDPSLAGKPRFSQRGPVRAILILFAFVFVPMALGMLAVGVMAPAFRQAMESSLALEADDPVYDYEEDEQPAGPVDVEAATAQVYSDADRIARLVWEYEASNGGQAEDLDLVFGLFEARNPDTSTPLDPFDGYSHGFDRTEDGFSIWSTGPDLESRTEDDIVVEFAASPP